MTTAAAPRPPAPPAPLTPDDLLQMPDEGKGYELVDGELKEKSMSARSSRVGGRVFTKLENYSDTVSPGWVFASDAGFQCFAAHPGRVRRADVAFITFGRMTREQYEEDGFIEIVPDLVVEVVSPKDLFREVDEKRVEWQLAGVQEVWVVVPTTGSVQVYRAGGSSVLGSLDTLTTPLLPRFSVPVAELFRLPGPPAQSPAAGGE
jgi:Uma2 family endonuclease